MHRSIGDAIENERFERYVIHSAEDYFGPIARYQLLDEAPTVFYHDSFIHIIGFPLYLSIHCYCSYCSSRYFFCSNETLSCL